MCAAEFSAFGSLDSNSAADLATAPPAIIDIFYGSFYGTWHSCVHSYWAADAAAEDLPGVALSPRQSARCLLSSDR